LCVEQGSTEAVRGKGYRTGSSVPVSRQKRRRCRRCRHGHVFGSAWSFGRRFAGLAWPWPLLPICSRTPRSARPCGQGVLVLEVYLLSVPGGKLMKHKKNITKIINHIVLLLSRAWVAAVTLPYRSTMSVPT